jgi:hypothetical protein
MATECQNGVHASTAALGACSNTRISHSAASGGQDVVDLGLKFPCQFNPGCTRTLLALAGAAPVVAAHSRKFSWAGRDDGWSAYDTRVAVDSSN